MTDKRPAEYVVRFDEGVYYRAGDDEWRGSSVERATLLSKKAARVVCARLRALGFKCIVMSRARCGTPPRERANG